MTKWYNLITVRDDDGYPIGLSVKAFAQNPPKLYEITLNAHSNVTLMDDSAHGMMFSNTLGSVVPFYFGGTYGRTNLFSLPTKENVQIGFKNNAPFFRSTESVLFSKHYLLLGSYDDVMNDIESVTIVETKATMTCFEESEFMCSTTATFGIHKNVDTTEGEVLQQDVTVDFFTQKWILPRKFESDIRRGYALHQQDTHSDFVFEITFEDLAKNPYTVQCDFECYTRHVNPFDSPALWIDFVEDMTVGIPYDWIQDQDMLVTYEPQQKHITLASTEHLSTTLQDVVNASIFFLTLVIIYRLTHTHSFHVHSSLNKKPVDPTPRYHLLLLDFVYVSIPILATVLSFVLLYNTIIQWYQFALTIYIQVLVIGSIVLVRYTNELNNRFHRTLAVFNHQAYTDLLFLAVISTTYFLLSDLVVVVLVAFHLVLLVDGYVGALLLLPDTKKARRTDKFPGLLLLMTMEAGVVIAIEAFFYILPQMEILSAAYGGRLTTYLSNMIFLILVVAVGVALRVFSFRTASEKITGRSLDVF